MRFVSNEAYNEVLFETTNFKVIPSLGSIVEGWLLIIPKTHYISFGAIQNLELFEELRNLLNHVTDIIKAEYGQFCVFEHGPSDPKMKVGCGVDYAHIHVVPVSLDIKKVETLSKEGFNWVKVDNVEDTKYYFELNQSYLYFQDSFHNCHIATDLSIPSQYFRKIIASLLGKAELFDWNKNFFLDNVCNTYKKLKKYKGQFKFSKINEYA